MFRIVVKVLHQFCENLFELVDLGRENQTGESKNLSKHGNVTTHDMWIGITDSMGDMDVPWCTQQINKNPHCSVGNRNAEEVINRFDTGRASRPSSSSGFPQPNIKKICGWSWINFINKRQWTCWSWLISEPQLDQWVEVELVPSRIPNCQIRNVNHVNQKHGIPSPISRTSPKKHMDHMRSPSACLQHPHPKAIGFTPGLWPPRLWRLWSVRCQWLARSPQLLGVLTRRLDARAHVPAKSLAFFGPKSMVFCKS